VSQPGCRRLLFLLAVALILLLQTALLADCARRLSPTFDEPGHLVAGVANLKLGRFEVYRVNPPLTRMIAALPVLAVGAKEDWSRFHDLPGARPEMMVGSDFVDANGPRTAWLFTLARWACLPLTLAGGLICLAYGTELAGKSAGLIALVLYAFDPNVIAHGALVTPDAAATSLGLGAGYTFWRWLRRPGWTRAWVAGALLGLAELSKLSWLILFPLWPMIWLLWTLTCVDQTTRVQWAKQAFQLTLILAAAIYSLNAAYGFDRTCEPLESFSFVSSSLNGGTAGVPGNRFASTWVGKLPVPVPRQYLLGLDAQKKDHEHYQGISYLRGEWREGGWWYYYLYGLIIKTPLGTHLLVAASVVAVLAGWRRGRGSEGMRPRDAVVVLVPAITLVGVVSSQTEFNHHLRYVLPAFGFVYVFTGAAVAAWAKRSTGRLIIAACLGGTVVSTFAIHPHELSYFNEFVGGPDHGHEHLLNSNLDWGQDLLFLEQWMQAQPAARPLHLAYFGSYDPRSLMTGFSPRDSTTGLGMAASPSGLEPGFYAVSENLLRDRYRFFVEPSPAGESRIQEIREVGQAGYSIRIFQVR
jgi:4-amino-4-deoxy-L-arabinose transferase-like glycosyltransferase